MGKSQNFTADRIAKFGCEPGKQQSIFWDAKTPGLGLRVTAAGAKSYIFEARLHGKTLRLTIGGAKTWTIAKAQAEATDLKSQTDKGIDPRQLAAEQRTKAEAAAAEAKQQQATVGEAWSAYISYQRDKMGRPNIERGRKWGARHLADHEQMAQAGGQKKKRGGKGLTKPGVLYPLMGLRLRDVTAERLVEWQRAEAAERANKARQAFESFRTFLRWAAGQPEYAGIDLQAVEARTVRDEVPRSRARESDCLQREQLAAWFTEVRKLAPVHSAYLQALLLTGARREELATLRCENVDFQWKTITIRDKVEGERIIPMTPHVEILLRELHRINNTPPAPTRILHGKRIAVDVENWHPSQWVFFANSASGRLREPNRAHTRALAAAGLPSVSIHGLRRSFASLAEWIEMPAGVVAQIMGHKPSATAERHYKRRPIDLLRMWHTKYEAWILEQAAIQLEASTPHGLRAVG
jgi:integrase